MKKRVISMFLILTILVGLLPVYAQAEETQAAVDNGDLTVEGTNGFGALLSEDIALEQETLQEQEASGYTLTDLEITGHTATVTYDSLEEATLVVALYTEDGMQLLTSGKTTVDPEQTQATITIEGEMPEYFMASAYLLDSYGMSPLCPAYDTPMYTQEMQELLASTVDDYDAGRVLQLEESKETNFAVYAETTKVIEPVEGVNTVASVDDESRTYVIKNVDSQITSLAAGDVFAYSYSDTEILIVKVTAITLEGTTATITGGELELEQVFDYAKIEGTVNTDDAQVDMSFADEGVDYLGMMTEVPTTGSITSYGLNEGSFSNDTSVQFEYKSNQAGKFHFVGSVKLHIKVSLKYYVSLSYQRLMVRLDYGGEIEVGVEVDALDKQGKSLEGKLGKITLPVIPGVSVEFVPALVADITVSLTVKLTYGGSLGFGFENDSSGARFLSLCTPPRFSTDLKLDGKLFVGLKLTPKMEIVDGLIAEVEVSAKIGAEISGEVMLLSTDYWSEERHNCTGCIGGDISGVLTVTPSVQFLKNKNLEFSVSLVDLQLKLFDYYLCPQHGKSGMTKCPNIAYKTTILVKDEEGKALSQVTVTTGAGETIGSTNQHGVLVTWLPAGNYQFIAAVEGRTSSAAVKIEKATSVIIVIPYEEVIASGICGDNAFWKLYRSGTLYIYGFGEMYSWAENSAPPWEIWDGIVTIETVLIEKDITSIGNWAFAGCYYLTNVTIPDSVISIGDSAFSNLDSLNNVTIPDSVTSIGNEAFYDCNSLVSVKIGNAVTDIGGYAFSGCENLTSVTIPGSVTSMGSTAFGWCENLISVTILDGATSIGYCTFWGCKSLTSVTIPDSVVSIGMYAFYQCTSLKNVRIGNSVTEIESYAFFDCNGLTSITIPNSVTSIGDYAFDSCDGLTSITIPYSVTSIGERAFSSCESLTDVYYTGTKDQWNAIGIRKYNYALSWATIHYNSAIVSTGMTGCAVSHTNRDEAFFSSEYTAEAADAGTIKTAYFTGLAPGQNYVFLSLVIQDAEDPLLGDNLLFIDQATAGEDGSLSFKYIQRVNTDPSYVMVCGASTLDLANAQIIFPEMVADGEIQVVQPTVVYDGKALVEEQDYVILGDTDFTEAGEYTCYIRGIYGYTGLVSCTYTVSGSAELEPSTKPTISLKYPTVSFEDVIVMNIYYAASDLEDVVEMGLITYGEKVGEYGVDTAEHVIPGYAWSEADGFYYSTTTGIAAKDLGDTIYFAVYAKLVDGTYTYTNLVGYSPKTYAYNQLKSGTEEMKPLVVAMLNYGAAAQAYFNYNTDALVNANLTAEQNALITAYSADLIPNVTLPDDVKKGEMMGNGGYTKRYPTISFEGAFCINYYFVPSSAPVGDITMYVWNQADFDAANSLSKDNTTEAITMALTESGEYLAVVDGIAAKHLDQGVYVSFCYSDGTTDYCSGVIGYSIGAYCKSQAAKTGTLADLAAATAIYGHYAKQLFN